MCIPPINQNTENYFKEMFELNKSLNLEELSMGMSADFLEATKNHATFKNWFKYFWKKSLAYFYFSIFFY